MYKHSATELRQLASKQTLQFCILLLGGSAMLQSHSQQTNESILFFKNSFYSWNFFTLQIYHLHNFFLSLPLHIRCIISLARAF